MTVRHAFAVVSSVVKETVILVTRHPRRYGRRRLFSRLFLIVCTKPYVCFPRTEGHLPCSVSKTRIRYLLPLFFITLCLGFLLRGGGLLQRLNILYLYSEIAGGWRTEAEALVQIVSDDRRVFAGKPPVATHPVTSSTNPSIGVPSSSTASSPNSSLMMPTCRLIWGCQ